MPVIRASPSALISLGRYGSRECHLAVTSRRPHHQPHKSRKTLSSAQKAARKLTRTQHRVTFNAAIERALQVVVKQAKELAEQFPTHNMQYYFQLLMQHARKKGGRRRINL